MASGYQGIVPINSLMVPFSTGEDNDVATMWTKLLQERLQVQQERSAFLANTSILAAYHPVSENLREDNQTVLSSIGEAWKKRCI